jgi:hypothetical protein
MRAKQPRESLGLRLRLKILLILETFVVFIPKFVSFVTYTNKTKEFLLKKRQLWQRFSSVVQLQTKHQLTQTIVQKR